MAEALAALFWDVDGTLAETEFDGHRRAFNRALRDAGLPWRWDVPTYRRLLAVNGGRERLAHFLTDVEGAVPREARVERLMAAKQGHYVALVREGSVSLRPGVARLIVEASQAGVRQLVVTTSSRSAVEALAEGTLRDLAAAFEAWVCGEDVAAKKPDPEAYRRALERVDLEPSRVLVLEDSAQGLAAAAGADLPCLVTLSRLSRSEPPQAFMAARAVVEGLGEEHDPVQVHRGPPCPEGRVTLSWMRRLLGDP